MTRQGSPDPRFRRAQAGPSKRRRSHLRTLVVALRRAAGVAIVAAAAYGSAHALLASSAFTVQRVTVRGVERLSAGEVLELVGDLRGEHVLRTNLDAWRDRVLQSPWVSEASVRRLLPATVAIDIVERTPLAIARLDRRLYLLDVEGTTIDEFGPQHADLDLPIVDGLPVSAEVDRTRVALLARVLASLDEAGWLGRLSQIDVSDTRDVVVVLEGDSAALHLGDSAFAERVGAYLELEPTLKARVPDIDYVDLRFEPRVYVRPMPGTDTADTLTTAALRR